MPFPQIPQDLIYKPIEAFVEKGLEPRLVKLRYDFFEAKRRDLLTACRRSRDVILQDEDKVSVTIRKIIRSTKTIVLSSSSSDIT